MMLKVEREMAKKMMSKKMGDDEMVLLISYVQSRKCLWDEKHADFKRVSITRKLWNEIGTQLNITGDEAKFKWQNLKGKFKKLLRKNLEDNKIAGSTSATPKWKFYHSMLFLKDTFVHSYKDTSVHSEAVKSTTSMAANNAIKNINSRQPEENDDDFEEFNFDFIMPKTSDTETNDRKQKPGPRSSKRKITSNGEVDDKTQEPDDKNFLLPPTLVHQDERKGNDDHHFLWSLVPYIQALDSVEKLELRSQIQNLVTTSFKKHETNKRSRMYH